MTVIDIAPRPSAKEHPAQTSLLRGKYVVLIPIADVGGRRRIDLLVLDQPFEERNIRLLGTKIVRGDDEVSGQVQLVEQPPSANGLVPRDSDAVAGGLKVSKTGPHVGIEIPSVEE